LAIPSRLRHTCALPYAGQNNQQKNAPTTFRLIQRTSRLQFFSEGCEYVQLAIASVRRCLQYDSPLIPVEKHQRFILFQPELSIGLVHAHSFPQDQRSLSVRGTCMQRQLLPKQRSSYTNYVVCCAETFAGYEYEFRCVLMGLVGTMYSLCCDMVSLFTKICVRISSTVTPDPMWLAVTSIRGHTAPPLRRT
jgi:hypothetical protein